MRIEIINAGDVLPKCAETEEPAVYTIGPDVTVSGRL
jgi:hypothetical protein